MIEPSYMKKLTAIATISAAQSAQPHIGGGPELLPLFTEEEMKGPEKMHSCQT